MKRIIIWVLVCFVIQALAVEDVSPAVQESADTVKTDASATPEPGPYETKKEKKMRLKEQAASKPQSPAKDSVITVKHRFNHKEQVIVGGVIMASIALILVTMNNYNPK